MGLFCFVCRCVSFFLFKFCNYFRNAEDVPVSLIDATDQIPSFNVIPLYGLNCFSIMKHETFVISMRALNALEEKILKFIHKTGPKNVKYKYIDFKDKILAEAEHEEDPKYTPIV